MKVLIVLSAALILCAIQTKPTSAETWNILPDGTGDAPTIQAGINLSSSGDIIELADGTFTGTGNRDIDYMGKAIIIRSQSGNPESCIIDSEGSSSDHHRGFYFHHGEGSDSVLEGITITGGHYQDGGGIYCDNASPTIFNTVILQNVAEDRGGGIFCIGASPSISENRICGNTAGNQGGEGGGGIFCIYCPNPTINDNIIRDNFSYSGGGIDFFDSHPSISNNTIEDNLAFDGGGIGLCCSSSATITDNTIKGNEAYNNGGAIFCNSGAYAYISNNFILNNIASGTFSYGGAICCNETSPWISGNLFVGNSAASGGGIACRANSNPNIMNNTMSENSANLGGGLYCDNHSTPDMSACIIANSIQGIAVYCSDSSAIPTLHCCNVYGNAYGDWSGYIEDQIDLRGNFSAPPCFCDVANDEYHLCADSWCLPGNHPWGCDELVGAYGEGCGACDCPAQGPVPTSVITWGRMKTLYK